MVTPLKLRFTPYFEQFKKHIDFVQYGLLKKF